MFTELQLFENYNLQVSLFTSFENYNSYGKTLTYDYALTLC